MKEKVIVQDRDQQEAIYAKEPSVVVQAGAGSGKTHVVAERVKTMLRNNPDLEPKRIAVVTFTRAGARELRERIGQGPWIGTIHSLGLQMLRAAGDWRPVIPAGLQMNLLRQVIGRDDPVVCAQKLTQERFTSDGQNPSSMLVNYRFHLGREGWLDFDDLVCLPPARELAHFKGAFDVLIVDEAQDTAEREWELLAKCLSPLKSVTIVGDPQQSIYGFRGVPMYDESHYLSELMPGPDLARLCLLRTNYRSARTIVEVANGIATELRHGMALRARPTAATGSVRRVVSEYDSRFSSPVVPETGFLVQEYRLDGAPPSASAAILCRTNREVGAVQSAFRDAVWIMSKPEILTMHAAKGREWNEVFVIGLNDDRFPLRHADQEEEKRLLYVAATRARVHLVFVGEGTPSRFWSLIRGGQDDAVGDIEDGAVSAALYDQGRADVGNGRHDSDVAAAGGVDAPPRSVGVRRPDDGE